MLIIRGKKNLILSIFILKITKNELISQTLRDLISYVERDLRHSKHGGFYCAEDADSLPTKNDTKKKEGSNKKKN